MAQDLIANTLGAKFELLCTPHHPLLSDQIQSRTNHIVSTLISWETPDCT